MNEQILNIKFAEEVEKHPILYNYKLPGYCRKYLKKEAWYEEGKEVQNDKCEAYFDKMPFIDNNIMMMMIMI